MNGFFWKALLAIVVLVPLSTRAQNAQFSPEFMITWKAQSYVPDMYRGRVSRQEILFWLCLRS